MYSSIKFWVVIGCPTRRRESRINRFGNCLVGRVPIQYNMIRIICISLNICHIYCERHRVGLCITIWGTIRNRFWSIKDCISFFVVDEWIFSKYDRNSTFNCWVIDYEFIKNWKWYLSSWIFHERNSKSFRCTCSNIF